MEIEAVAGGGGGGGENEEEEEEEEEEEGWLEQQNSFLTKEAAADTTRHAVAVTAARYCFFVAAIALPPQLRLLPLLLLHLPPVLCWCNLDTSASETLPMILSFFSVGQQHQQQRNKHLFQTPKRSERDV